MDLETIQILIRNCKTFEEVKLLETILFRIEPAKWFVQSVVKMERDPSITEKVTD